MILKILAIIILIIFLFSLRKKFNTIKNYENVNQNVNEEKNIKEYKCKFPSAFDKEISNPYYEDHDVVRLPTVNPCQDPYIKDGKDCVRACRTCKMGVCEDGLCFN